MLSQNGLAKAMASPQIVRQRLSRRDGGRAEGLARSERALHDASRGT
jgi:hypothetical protein